MDVSCNTLTRCTPFLNGIAGNAALRQLDLSRNALSDDAAPLLARLLSAESCALTALDLSRCNLSSVFALKWTDALTLRSAALPLVSLSLAHNPMAPSALAKLLHAMIEVRILA